AGKAVAAGIEGRPGDHNVGRNGAKRLGGLRGERRGLLSGQVVATHQCRRDLARRLEQLLQPRSWSDRAGQYPERGLGGRLAAQPPVKLIDVVDNADQGDNYPRDGASAILMLIPIALPY